LTASAGDYAATPLKEREQAALKIAAGLKVDGDGRDWNGYPARFSSYMNGRGDLSRALFSTRVLADEGGLHICICTKGTPSTDDDAFGFQLDFADTQAKDVEFSDTAGNQCTTVTYFSPDNPAQHFPIQNVEAAVGQCVEWYVPWQSLAQALPESERDKVVGPNVRPWVRVTPYSWDRQQRMIMDYGAAFACPRLPIQSEMLNPPLPSPSERADLPLMVEGQSYVICGANEGPGGTLEHKDNFCYDFTVMAVQGFPAWLPMTHDNLQYPAFGRNLFAPVDGEIIGIRDSIADHPARIENKGLPSNYVFLKSGDKVLWFVHNKQHSCSLRVGDKVQAGDLVAKIGDTGPSAGPHVHFQVEKGSAEPGRHDHLVPVVLKNVRVSLNGGGNDYWAQDLSEWLVQEGNFVEANKPLNIQTNSP
jgi:hypothetical protein